MKSAILHIAIDYDNPHRGRPTKAIKNFIHRITFADNLVISLKRSSNPLAIFNRLVLTPPDPKQPHVTVATMTYFGLPGGIGLRSSMNMVADVVLNFLVSHGVTPLIVHSHKLTFEGIVALKIAEERNIPMFSSVRGEVEAKLIRFKPLHKYLFQEIVHRSERLYFVSAWFKEPMKKLFLVDDSKIRLLPNEVQNETRETNTVRATEQLLTVFNLNDWNRKGFKQLVSALALLRSEGSIIKVDVFGGGTPRAIRTVKKIVEKHHLKEQVIFCGKVDNTTLLKQMNKYKCLVLPSRNETFGMVYAEALFAGIPVIMNENSGIDGYLPDMDVALYVRTNDVNDLARKITKAVEMNLNLREEVSRRKSEIFNVFSIENTMRQYEADVSSVLNDRLT